MLVRTYGILADPVTLSAATPVGSTVTTIITAWCLVNNCHLITTRHYILITQSES